MGKCNITKAREKISKNEEIAELLKVKERQRRPLENR